VTELRADQAFLRDVQYRSDANLAARQSIYGYQQPRVDLVAEVLGLVDLPSAGLIADIGCGNGRYLAELTRRGFLGRSLGIDLSAGMLAAARAAAPPAGLAAADVSALPLGDGVARLTLAMHMLYHVPDPAGAIRELRRVTRPGGAVIVGLNGAGHMREMRTAIEQAGLGYPRERVSLDEGETLLRAVFPTVTRYDFPAQLRLPGPEPVADYVRSISQAKKTPDIEAVIRDITGRIFRSDAVASFNVTAHAGCLVCV